MVIFLDITPCSPLKIGFPSAFRLVSCSSYSSLKMEAIFSSETLVDFQRVTRRYSPENSTLQLQAGLAMSCLITAVYVRYTWYRFDLSIKTITNSLI
jgi:hypothetical protein